MPDRNQICKQWGIKLLTRKETHPKVLGPKQCKSGGTIIKVAERGIEIGRPDHIHDVLYLMMTTEANQRALYRDCILGVSTYLLAHKLFDHNVVELAERFSEKINLSEIYADVLHHKINDRRSAQIAFVIALGMEQ